MDQKVIDEHERTENPEIGRYDQLKRNRSRTKKFQDYLQERIEESER
jgi:hypothetical protein